MAEVAQYGIIVLLSGSLIFHLLVLSKVIPYAIVWGGRINSEKEMIRFELISILVNLLLLFITVAYTKILHTTLPTYFLKIGMWLMVALFTLNTIGNLFSKNKFEKKVFTPITILLTILSVILVVKG